jgi:hypothetical protein
MSRRQAGGGEDRTAPGVEDGVLYWPGDMSRRQAGGGEDMAAPVVEDDELGEEMDRDEGVTDGGDEDKEELVLFSGT